MLQPKGNAAAFGKSVLFSTNIGVASRLKLRRRPIFLVRPTHHDPERLIRQRPLQRVPSSQGARIQTSRSSSVVKITGMAFGCIGFATPFASVVKKP